MFGRIQNIDNRVLDNISRIHKPALNKIMITASRAGNAGIVWWAICLPFLINSNWRATGANFVFGLAWAHLMGEIIIKHIVKRVRPCHTLDDDEQLIDRPRFYSFPSGHTTASFDRSLMNAETFLSMDLTIRKDEADGPQILIYHTHSQENYRDYAGSDGKGAVVSLGEELAKRLRAKGYQVWHDTTAYDMKSGHLDRSRAYTYACEGVTNLLQKYPSIQVILDVHRDGVSEQTHLVTQIEGKPTAQIMFFNGTSETPDGPILWQNSTELGSPPCSPQIPT